MSKVRTVTGTVDSSELGLVLPHEHLHNDVTGAYTEAPDPVVAQRLAGPVRAEDAWLLHDNPYYSLDNCRVDDAAAVVEDLADFARLGGRTIVDLTPPGLGRAPEKLAEFSRTSDVRVIMGSGWYSRRPIRSRFTNSVSTIWRARSSRSSIRQRNWLRE
ncbi:hypothetical protein GCM10020255_018140 [Rhodococcus baikonurensis]